MTNGAVKVVFTYHENAKTWAINVEGCITKEDASDAFQAVALSCKYIETALLPFVRVDDNHNISVAVSK